MKRWWNLLLCALVFGMILLAGCAEKPVEKKDTSGVFAFCGGDLQDFAETSDENEIAYMEYRYTMDAPISCHITDKMMIKTIFDALCKVKVGEKNNVRTTDSEQSLTFVKVDGTSYTIRFEQYNLLYERNAYRLENDAELWKALREAK